MTHRRAARRDDNEEAIVLALEAAGATVVRISAKDVPDLLIGYRGANYLQEVKQLGAKGKTKRTTRGAATDADGRSKGQADFARDWRGGPVVVVRTPEEALAAIGVSESKTLRDPTPENNVTEPAAPAEQDNDTMTITIDIFMADRGAPYMTPDARAAAEAEWARWERHIATGGCPSYATVEIRPENGGFEDFTHACYQHVGALLGHRAGAPEPRHYEARILTGDEAKSMWCCEPAKP